MSEFNMSGRVKQLASQRGMTLKDVSEKMGVVPQRLNSILRGQFSISSLSLLAETLEVEVYELFKPKEGVADCSCPHCGKPLKVTLA